MQVSIGTEVISDSIIDVFTFFAGGADRALSGLIGDAFGFADATIVGDLRAFF